MLEMIFSQILKMSLTAGVCIVVVSMLHLVFHRIPRKYLYALWIVVAFRLVCPVSVLSLIHILYSRKCKCAFGQSDGFFMPF